jgi:hypothetical protein
MNKNFIICALHKLLLDNQIEEDMMNGAYSTHGRDAKYVHNVSGKSEETNWELEAYREENIKMGLKIYSI